MGKIKTLWRLAASERASPREIGWAVAIGAFAACTPAIGLRSALALGLATLFKKNRLFAWLGTRISNMVFLPFIVIAEVQVSHRLRTGTWVELNRETAIDQAGTFLLDWCLGTIPVGSAIAFVMGMSAWAIALVRDRRREAKTRADQPAVKDEDARANDVEASPARDSDEEDEEVAPSSPPRGVRSA